MNIKIKRLTPSASTPTKAHEDDACFDIYADISIEKKFFGEAEEIRINPGSYANIHTGISSEIPEGYFAAIFDRSGMGIKRHLRLSNSVGIIDSNYRGEWMVCLHNDGEEIQIIKHRDRIAQFAILPVLDVNIEDAEEISETNRGENGFGSTGR